MKFSNNKLDTWHVVRCPISNARDAYENIIPEGYTDLEQWCLDSPSNSKFHWAHGFWYFENESDAIWFAMRWDE